MVRGITYIEFYDVSHLNAGEKINLTVKTGFKVHLMKVTMFITPEIHLGLKETPVYCNILQHHFKSKNYLCAEGLMQLFRIFHYKDILICVNLRMFILNNKRLLPMLDLLYVTSLNPTQMLQILIPLSLYLLLYSTCVHYMQVSQFNARS